MNEQKQLEQAGQDTEKIMKPYTGDKGAHFGFIATAERKYFCFGGRTDLLVYGLAETIAHLVQRTPDAAAPFMDTIMEAARTMLARMKGGAAQ